MGTHGGEPVAINNATTGKEGLGEGEVGEGPVVEHLQLRIDGKAVGEPAYQFGGTDLIAQKVEELLEETLGLLGGDGVSIESCREG